MDARKILNADFLDILFEGRNKEYGAYALRKSYPRRLTTAIIVAASLAGLLLLMSFALPNLTGRGNKERVEDVELTKANKDVPPPPPPKPTPPPPPSKVEGKKIELTKFTPPKFVPKEEVKEEEKIKDPEEVINVSDKSQEGAKVEVPTTYTGGDDKGKVAEPPKEEPKQEEDKIYNKVEIEANFKGFKEFLEKNLRYPSDAEEAGQSGVVVIEFVVDREGKISDPHVADNSPVKVNSLVEEAIRIIKKSSGKWAPGIQNGTPVRSYHQQSINFVLAEEE